MRLLDLALACAVLSWLTCGALAQNELSASAYGPSPEQLSPASGSSLEAASATSSWREGHGPQQQLFPVVSVSWQDDQGEAGTGGSQISVLGPPESERLSPSDAASSTSSMAGATYATDGTSDSKDDRQPSVSPAAYQAPSALPPAALPPEAPAPSSLPPPVAPPIASPNHTTIDWNCAAAGGPMYELAVEAILWRMEHTRGQAVAENPLRHEVTYTDDLDLGTAAGPRISMRCLSDESEVLSGAEVSYFGVYDWDTSMALSAPNGTYLRLPDTLGDVGQTDDYSHADGMWLYSDSQLDSVEANLRFGAPASEFHVLFGPRYIRLEEDFAIDSYTGPRMSFYDVATRNSLWGVQLGVEWQRRRRCWELDSYVKTGIYNNRARQWTLLTDNDRTEVLRDFATKVTENSFVCDAGVSLARRINQIWLVRAGYSVFWMNNVARAADQLDFSNNPLSGSLLFMRQDALAHGFNVGLEATW
jgi:hypothetical protein